MYTYGEQVMCKIQLGIRAGDKGKGKLGYCLTARCWMTTGSQTWASQVSLNNKRVFLNKFTGFCSIWLLHFCLSLSLSVYTSSPFFFLFPKLLLYVLFILFSVSSCHFLDDRTGWVDNWLGFVCLSCSEQSLPTLSVCMYMIYVCSYQKIDVYMPSCVWYICVHIWM